LVHYNIYIIYADVSTVSSNSAYITEISVFHLTRWAASVAAEQAGQCLSKGALYHFGKVMETGGEPVGAEEVQILHPSPDRTGRQIQGTTASFQSLRKLYSKSSQ